MKKITIFLLLFIFICFAGMIGLVMNTTSVNEIKTCPDLLVRKGNGLSLLHSNLPKKMGTNPLYFDTLEDYKIYVDRERENGIHCPVLYLRESNDIQGNDVLKVFADPFNEEWGIASLPIVNGIDIENSLSPEFSISRSVDELPINGYDKFDLQEAVFT